LFSCEGHSIEQEFFGATMANLDPLSSSNVRVCARSSVQEITALFDHAAKVVAFTVYYV